MDVIKPLAVIFVVGYFLSYAMNAAGASNRSESLDQCVLVEARMDQIEANMERMRNKIDRILQLIDELENGYDHRNPDHTEASAD